jgi:hypothetical protein
MSEIDYSMEYHHVNCDEYFWPDTDVRIFPCILFLANTRDEKLYAENVSILSQMYKRVFMFTIGLYFAALDRNSSRFRI